MDEDYGKKIYHLLLGVVVVLAVVGLYLFSTRNTDKAESGPSGASCAEVLSTLVAAVRDDTGIDGGLVDTFGDRCPSEYKTLVDCTSIKSMSETDLSGGPCAELRNYDLARPAIRLARRDGYCR